MVVMAPGKELLPDLLPMAVMAFDPHQETDQHHGLASFESRLKSYMRSETHSAVERGAVDLYDIVRAKWERYLFEAVLNATHNNKSKAALLLGITRNTLGAKLKELCEEKREWNVE
jgi:DNA-binding protein Fis